MRVLLFSALFLLMNSPVLADRNSASNVEGLWMTASNTGMVRIENCADGSPCGTLVWIASSVPDLELDNRNPDPDLRTRPMVGIKMLWGFKAGKGKWKKGRIYSPENGKTYRSAIALMPNGTLQVKGCIGPVCQAQTWLPVDLQNMQQTHAPASAIPSNSKANATQAK